MSILSGATYLAALLLSGAIATFMGALGVRNRDRRGALTFAVLMGCFIVWSLTEAVTLLTTSLFVAKAARLVMFVGIAFSPVALLSLAMQYTGREHLLSSTSLGLVCVVPTVTTLLIATNPLHSLVWSPAGFTPIGRFSTYQVTPNVWFWVHTAYSYLLLVVASVFFVRGAFRKRGTYSGQSRAIMVGLGFPWVANVVSLFGPWEFTVDLTPIFFTVSGVFVGIAVLRYQFLDVVPVARDSVVEVMREGVLVVDDQGRVLDANPAALDLFASDLDAIVGRPLDAVAPASLVGAATGEGSTSTVTMTDDGGERQFDVRRSTIPGGGQVALLYDVTEHRAQARHLERQNERLERFAGVLSHDLRNPLNVAQGYVGLVEADSPHLDRVDTALSRMETLVDDTLELTREGQTVTDPEPVTLSAVAEQAWANVVTGRATLDVQTTKTVAGDARRLTRLFENLFRNSVEHGSRRRQSSDDVGTSERVTVTISDVPGGFAVEDDGVGIPEAAREALFEFGYSTSDDGTGLGLAIVAEITEAHGWQVSLAEESEGARFEFTGLDVVAEAE
jgi:signal transduction histidine kinase